jgi:hypothetical protein
MDLLSVGNNAAIAYAMSTYSVQSGNGTFLLEDGTKVVLAGFHDASLTRSDFK